MSKTYIQTNKQTKTELKCDVVAVNFITADDTLFSALVPGTVASENSIMGVSYIIILLG